MFKRFVCVGLFVSFLMAVAVLPASAAFDWKAHNGTEIKLLLNKHPYTDALLAHLGEFTEKTGIAVTSSILR